VTSGIISYLMSLAGDNSHDRRLAQAMLYSTFSPNHLPKLVAGVANIFGRGILNWLCHDFKGRRILPTH
jgi:hypothetical protein